MTSLNDIRSTFLDFFESRGHEIVRSAPLVPQNDPTLMFVNAGMVPFKDIFTGIETRPYQRAVSSQKCVRAGGKHNDLDNVGYTARHHTFFEMLGNFSFGDYFKEEAIEAAWALVTGEFGLAKDRLLVTVYHTDEEAFALWRKISGLDEKKIIRIPTSDNFWSMGELGPCGPCSEIFYDHGRKVPGGPPGSAEEDGDRFVEIWNLVFMQFERHADGAQTSLPRPSIDTGMGLERMAAVLQGYHDNYETDLFRSLISASEEITAQKAVGEMNIAHRVVADHLRAASFLLADGVSPSNEGRGYVLRRIMRRAMRYAHALGAREPLLAQLAPVLIRHMGTAFPELMRAQSLITETLRAEEDKFRALLERGLKNLASECATLAPDENLPGAVAFKLYDTYGFPLDLTQDAMRREGRGVDITGFETAMDAQKAAARASWVGSGAAANERIWLDLRETFGATEFIGYVHVVAEGVVTALVAEEAQLTHAETGMAVEILVNQTPFYGESGGQAGDRGMIRGQNGALIEITDVQKRAGVLVAHQGRVIEGTVKTGDIVRLEIDVARRNRTRANHSATHLLHAALRQTLGDHVAQKGSQVTADRLRFDFSNNTALRAEDLARIEADVNTVIRQNSAVETKIMPLDDAINAGAIALFGEKYDEDVRVLTMGEALNVQCVDETLPDNHPAQKAASARQDRKPARKDRMAGGPAPYSVELCGGTHVARLGDIALFVITSETAVASGIRRIEALTGEAARQWLTNQRRAAAATAARLKVKVDDLPVRVEALAEEKRRLEDELATARKSLALAAAGSIADGGGHGLAGALSVNEVAPRAGMEEVNGIRFMARIFENMPAKELRGLVDTAKRDFEDGVIAFITVNDGKGAVTIGVGEALAGTVDAVELVRIAADRMGGKGGGGRADMAQAGGPDGVQARAALDAIRSHLLSREIHP